MGSKQSRATTAEAVTRFQAETNLGAVPVKELERVFRRFSTHGSLSPEAFNFALQALEQFGLRKVSRTPLAAQLFRVFDQDHNGQIDMEEFLAGATLLAAGTLEEKAEVTFRAFDTDGSGTIEEKELVDMVLASYDAAVKVALCIDDLSKMDELTSSVVSMVREQMQTLATDLMHKLDSNGDGHLDLAEFKLFCASIEDVRACVNGFSGRVNIIV